MREAPTATLPLVLWANIESGSIINKENKRIIGVNIVARGPYQNMVLKLDYKNMEGRTVICGNVLVNICTNKVLASVAGFMYCPNH